MKPMRKTVLLPNKLVFIKAEIQTPHCEIGQTCNINANRSKFAKIKRHGIINYKRNTLSLFDYAPLFEDPYFKQ